MWFVRDMTGKDNPNLDVMTGVRRNVQSRFQY